MPAATDLTADRAEQKQDEADHQDDDTDRPEDRDLEQETHYEQDET
jgi:hypothetical protein